MRDRRFIGNLFKLFYNKQNVQNDVLFL